MVCGIVRAFIVRSANGDQARYGCIRAWPTWIGRDLSDIEARHGIQGQQISLSRTTNRHPVCTVALRGLARPAAQTPLFRRRRGRRPGHECRVIYAVLPARPFFFLYRVSQRELESRPPSRHAFIGRVVESDIRATCTYMYHLYFRKGPWVAN